MRKTIVILLILTLVLSGCSLGGPKTTDTDVASGNQASGKLIETNVEVNSTKVETTNITIQICTAAENIGLGSCNVTIEEAKP